MYMDLNYLVFISIYILVNIFFILLYSKIAIYFDFLDRPDVRKNHKGDIPPVGGISIFSSIALFYYFLDFNFQLNIIFFCSLLLLFVGILDDKFQIGVTIRLFIQTLVCLIVVGAGIKIVNIGNYDLFNIDNLGIYGLLITIICVVGLTNAINFMDGIDGLSSGLLFASILSIAIYLYLEGNLQNFNLFTFLFLSLLIFMFFNFQNIKFKIFLGDSGTNSLGFLISWLLIYFSQPDINGFHPVLVLWCVTIPVFDFICITTNRILNKKNPFFPDRKHIHHLLMSTGLTNFKISLFLIILSFVFSFIGYCVFIFYSAFYCLLTYFLFFIIYVIINLKLRSL